MSKLITTKKDVFDVMDELYLLFYKEGDILNELDSENEAPIVLAAVKDMLGWDNDGEELYPIKLKLIMEDLKQIIPPEKYPEYWI